MLEICNFHLDQVEGRLYFGPAVIFFSFTRNRYLKVILIPLRKRLNDIRACGLLFFHIQLVEIRHCNLKMLFNKLVQAPQFSQTLSVGDGGCTQQKFEGTFILNPQLLQIVGIHVHSLT
jgi:hypothetical protein